MIGALVNGHSSSQTFMRCDSRSPPRSVGHTSSRYGRSMSARAASDLGWVGWPLAGIPRALDLTGHLESARFFKTLGIGSENLYGGTSLGRRLYRKRLCAWSMRPLPHPFSSPAVEKSNAKDDQSAQKHLMLPAWIEPATLPSEFCWRHRPLYVSKHYAARKTQNQG